MHQTDGLLDFTLERRGTGAPRPSIAQRPRRQWVAEVFEGEVLPRLLDAYAGKSPMCRPSPPCPAEPERLVALLREGRMAELGAAIEARLRSGASPQTVMIEDLAPAARRLGRLWDDDECDMVDVSAGLGALQSLLRDLIPNDSAPPAARSIIIALSPGETHDFGARMAESFFRSAGWSTTRLDGDRSGQALKREWHDAIGFSLSCERYSDSLARAVADARGASRNRRLKVLVGGAIFAEKPELAAKIGADLFASNAEATINVSRILLKELT